jgi:uncharacterized protein (TIGR00369 family)
MLSWDDFRTVKAIAERRTLSDAARTLGVNQSTVFRHLNQIETGLSVRLFKRSRSGYTLTPHGQRMVQLAERMENDAATFERSLHEKQAAKRTFTTGVVPLETIVSRSGLAFLQDMVAGRVPQAPMCATLGFHLTQVTEGFAVFEGLPEFRHFNPIGTVHGGFTATLLDSALGCAVFSTMAKGEAWTTLELKLNLVRPIGKDTGPVRTEGRILHRGRTVATAEGDVKDVAGKLYAHATTTCMIFPVNA